MKFKTLFYLAIAVFLLHDFAFSFVQYYELPLDGDLAGGIVPAKDVQAILDDPFGFELLKTKEIHPNPNRYFSHLIFLRYYQDLPIFLQDFFIPIESVYFSGALLRFGLQIGFLFVFSLIILPIPKRNIQNFLLVFALLTPLFQGHGYNRYIGIIDQAATYNFFYALPLLLLLVFYSFFNPFNRDNQKFKIPIWGYLFLVPALFILPLSSPLNPGVILIVTGIAFVGFIAKGWKKNEQKTIHILLNQCRKIPATVFFFFSIISIISLYSLFLGTYNITDANVSIPIAERYAKLPLGLWTILTESFAFTLLFLMILVSLFVLKKTSKLDFIRLNKELKLILIFSGIYLILLPLGGYRISRPLIIRYDTMMPITIALFYFFAKTAFHMIRSLHTKKLWFYSAFIFGVLYIFHDTDKRYKYQNLCEKDALIILSNSSEPVVELESNCSVISWQKITDPKQSELNAELLQLWNVTDNVIQYSSTSED